MIKSKTSLTALILITVLCLLAVLSCNTVTAPGSTGDTPGAVSIADEADITVLNNSAAAHFPDKIIFYLEAIGALPVKEIILEYNDSKRSILDEVTCAVPEFIEAEEINTLWTLELKKSGSLPPGALVKWRWKIVDCEGGTYISPEESIEFEDARYKWNVEENSDMDIYWYGHSSSFINTLTNDLEKSLSLLDLQTEIPEERKPRIFVYSSPEELRDAVLFSHSWAGAYAYYTHNIILIPCNADTLEWSKDTIAHEMTHLIVQEAVFGPYNHVPLWLNEGLAQYSEGDLSDDQREQLGNLARNYRLIPINSLELRFPSTTVEAMLAYLESKSIVSFMIDEYGWSGIRELLALFKEGNSCDNALKKVYSLSTSELDEKWHESLK